MVFYDLGDLGFAEVGKFLLLRIGITWDEFNLRFKTQLSQLSLKTCEALQRAFQESLAPPILTEGNELNSFFRTLHTVTAKIPSWHHRMKTLGRGPLGVDSSRIRNVKSFVLKEVSPSPPPVSKEPRYVRISFLYNTLVEVLCEFCNIAWSDTTPRVREQKITFLNSNIERTKKILVEVHDLDKDQIEDFWRQVLDAYVKLQEKIDRRWRQLVIEILSPILPTGVVPLYALCIGEKILDSKKPYTKEFRAFQELVARNYSPDQLEAIFEDVAFKQQLFIVSIRVPPTRKPPVPEKWSTAVVNNRWLAQTINERKDFKYKVIGQEISYIALETSFRLVGSLHTYPSILKILSQQRLLSKPLDYMETNLIIIGKPYLTMGTSLRIILGIVAAILSIYISLSRIFPPTP